MRTECQIIKTSHSFITVLLIYNKFPVIARLLALQCLPYHSPIAPWSAEAVLSNLFLASEAENLNLPSKIAFTSPIPSSVIEFSHWRFIRMAFMSQPTKLSVSSVESIYTSLSTYHLTEGKRSQLPLLFGSTFHRWPASSSLWKPSPRVNISIPL